MRRNYLTDRINSLNYKLRNGNIDKTDYHRKIQKLKRESRKEKTKIA